MYNYQKLIIFVLVSFLFACQNTKESEWKSSPIPLMTRWTADVDPAIPWSEYPRPQMVRDQWMNQNGLSQPKEDQHGFL